MAWNLIRLATSVTWRQPLEAYAPSPGPIYVGVTGATWALSGMVVFWGLMRGRSWSLPGLRVAAVAYATWSWMDRLLLQPRGVDHWMFDGVMTILLLTFTVATTLDSRWSTYFGREAQ